MTKHSSDKQVPVVTDDQSYLRVLNTPFDTDSFMYLMEVSYRASTGELHGSHISPPQPSDEPVLCFTDHPMNRAMMAVGREISHLSEDQRIAILWRIMGLGKLLEKLESDSRFNDMVRHSDKLVELHPDLILAYAAAPMVMDGDDIVPDMEAIWGAL